MTELSATGDQAAQLHRLGSIFQLAPVGIGIVDPDGQTVMSNGTLQRLLGYTVTREEGAVG